MSETQEEDAIMHDGPELLENAEQELAMQEDEPTGEMRSLITTSLGVVLMGFPADLH
jgi:hypothetical protein